ncbi:barstar family protein [Herbaspirillum rubrisubalbicans]|uniref:Barnase inhibitor n=1 Tax=Herbaspirillum rubrisubalbicans TaxID=80842 RepID=A0AAD0UBL2_9BURK|nr:barstar family protein [Herbaspirillum rubrisubalbicans]AYR26759.1 barnase inhibitor [Herbaspirillum rubrisubalbicans]
MKLRISGSDINNVNDFHNVFSKLLGIEQYYGKNYHALRDVLSSWIERPLHLEWTDSDASKIKLGADFEIIKQIFETVKLHDENYGWEDKFTYEFM